MSDAPDRTDRERAISARDRNVLIDAGAGAGKTSILVARILELTAPRSDELEAIALSKIAAVTFTRRAAGELRVRVRQSLLRELAKDCSEQRKRRLFDALASIDAAAIGTIHSFADRLLRLQPMAAELSPAYDLVDDADDLADATFTLLVQAAQSGTLAGELSGCDPTYASEVERTFQEALRAKFLVRSVDRDPAPPKIGLDLLARKFIEQRDRTLEVEISSGFDRDGFVTRARELLDALRGVIDDGKPGTRWLLQLRSHLEEALAEPDLLALYPLVERIAGEKQFKKTKDFTKNTVAQAVWVELHDGGAERLLAPLRATMARRLARTRHAIVHLYERIKQQHQAVDSVDLLLMLRNVLRDNLEARAFYQGLFDHLLVDELQDTDPLQAEIILYLTEATPLARRWQDVGVCPGKLTLVGDPKQSIYRFRRADVGMYDAMRTQVAASAHEAITLTANFRSAPRLIEWANERFAAVLGTSAKRTFDPASGQVYHQPQIAARSAHDRAALHHLPYGFADGKERNAAITRALEGEAIAAYLRWLVDRSGIEVEDPDTDTPRSIRWGDIAVLALVTPNLPLLFRSLDVQDVPYAMAGGTLFASDELHRRFLLGLRAIADRNDGVAEAAILRPPFFAVDLLDIVREKALASDEHAARAAAARAWIQAVRRDRFARPPGATARALLEETGIGRVAALGPNGEQRSRHLRELCLRVELIAAAEGLDYDGVTAHVREWIEHPPKLDPPRPIGAAAIQVLTVHQAKGLEFPVVVLWDGMGLWRPSDPPTPWRVDRDGMGWSMKTNDVTWEEPEGGTLLERDQAYAAAEKRRLVYVAATRARDLLVIPKPTWSQAGDKYIHACLLAEPRAEWIHSLEPYVEARGASWAQPHPERSSPTIADDAPALAAWQAVRERSSAPLHAPRSVTALAKQPIVLRVDDTELESPMPAIIRRARHGALFGDVVHRAIGLVLRDRHSSRDAVQRAATMLRLDAHLEEAVQDVDRAIAALAANGLLDGRTLRLEYPVGAPRDGFLVSGFIDLVSHAPSDTVVIDFKTDTWPRGVSNVSDAFPAYVAQVRTYASLLAADRAALLFTSTGRLEWT